MTTRKHSLWRVPAGSKESFKVTMLVRRLYQTELLPEAAEILDAYFYFLDYPETNLREEIPPDLREFVAGWAKKYLKSDNPDLVPFILSAELMTETRPDKVPAELIQDVLSTETETEEGFWFRSTNMFERDESDPIASTRPSNRIGRERYTAELNRHHEDGDITINGIRAREHADAWIKVRHGLTSLAAHVRSVGTRQYKKSDGGLRLNANNSYLWWWRNLKAVDAAIEAIVWPIPSSSN